MKEQLINRPMGPLLEGDQAIIDALEVLPADGSNFFQGLGETVLTDYAPNRETTVGLPKDHWSVANLKTDASGMPVTVESTLLSVSSKDINVILRGDGIDVEVRTEEDKPKATDRQKLHDRHTEQSIKLGTARRLHRAANTIKGIIAVDERS